MTGQPLFYSSIAVLDRHANRNLRVADGGKCADFSKSAHLIPAVVDEFFTACHELPILFVMSGGEPAPIFVVGVELGRNAMVDETGKWSTRHVPAYVRRYPFILGDVEGASSVVCIDGGYTPPETGGDALFSDNADNTAYLNSAIQFVNSYADAGRRTDEFVKALKEHDLLRGVTVDVKPQAGPSAVLHGLLSIDEKRLAELSDEAFLSLRKAGYLPYIYSQLLSLAAFSNLGNLVAGNAQAAAA